MCVGLYVRYLCLGSDEEVSLQSSCHHSHMLRTPNTLSDTHGRTVRQDGYTHREINRICVICCFTKFLQFLVKLVAIHSFDSIISALFDWEKVLQKTLVMWLLQDKVKAHLLVREAVFGDLVTCKTSLDNPWALKKRDKTCVMAELGWRSNALFSMQCVWQGEEVIRHSLRKPAVTRLAASRNIVPQITSVSTATLSWTVMTSKAKIILKPVTIHFFIVA